MLQLQELHQIDCKWSLWLHQKGLTIPRFILRMLEFSGDGLLWIPATAALGFAPWVQSSSRLQLFVLSLFLGFVLDIVLVATLKLIFKRPRPVYNKGMYLVVSMDHWSFPSGHSSRALFMATFCWLNFAILWDTLVIFSFISLEFLVFGWAITTAFSRILLGRHYCLDVLVGSCLGILEAVVVHGLLEDFAVSIHQVLKLATAELGSYLFSY